MIWFPPRGFEPRSFTTPDEPHSFNKVLSDFQKECLYNNRYEAASFVGTGISTGIVYPLDSIKTRMQAYNFKNVQECIRHTWKTEGNNGFWRGGLAPLLSVSCVRMYSFSAYRWLIHRYDEVWQKAYGESALDPVRYIGLPPTVGSCSCFFFSGGVVGALVTIAACPFELGKLNAQVEVLMASGGIPSYSGSTGPVNDAPSKPKPPPPPPPAALPGTKKRKKPYGGVRLIYLLYKERGFRSLYAGWRFHLIRDIVGTSLYFGVYETAKQLLSNHQGYHEQGGAKTALAGALSGLFSWAFIYPVDSAKSIYQRNYLAAKPSEAHLVPMPKVEMFNRRMYKGLGVSLARSALLNAIFFVLMERLKVQVLNITGTPIGELHTGYNTKVDDDDDDE